MGATDPSESLTGCAWYLGCDVLEATVHVDDLEDYCRPHAMLTADRLAGDYVRERDQNTCQRCGVYGLSLDWAHILGRGARYIRHDPENALSLCRQCHERTESRRAEFNAWLDERWPGRRDALHRQEADGLRSGHSLDFAAIIRSFRETTLTRADRRALDSGDWIGGVA